jgi:periplasmic protein TonB
MAAFHASTLSHAQTAPDKADPIYAVAETMPSFPGGQRALIAYLAGALEFPAEALDAPLDGPVQITFIVRRDGRITDATVVKGQHHALDAEALRLVEGMPSWEPGMQHGNAVSALVSLPIRFVAPKPAELVHTPMR